MLILTSGFPWATDHFGGSATYMSLASTCFLPPRPYHFLMCFLIPSSASHGIATYLLCHVLLPQTPSSLSSMAVLLAGPCGSCLLGLCVVCLACSASPVATPHGVDNSLAILIGKVTLPMWPLPYPCASGDIPFDTAQLLLTLAISQGLVIWCYCPSSP